MVILTMLFALKQLYASIIFKDKIANTLLKFSIYSNPMNLFENKNVKEVCHSSFLVFNLIPIRKGLFIRLIIFVLVVNSK